MLGTMINDTSSGGSHNLHCKIEDLGIRKNVQKLLDQPEADNET
jgi:hypothetical protein